MNETLKSMLLSRWFCLELLTGKTDSKTFSALAAAYGANAEEIKTLYGEVTDPLLLGINSRTSFNFYLRRIEYARVSGEYVPRVPMHLSQKGVALDIMESMEINDKTRARGSVYVMQSLEKAAALGVVEAMLLYGLTSYFGLFGEKTHDRKYLLKAENWNCAEAALMLASCDKNPAPHLAVLKSCSPLGAQSEALSSLAAHYGVSTAAFAPVWEHELLEKLFSVNLFDRRKYNATCSRLLYTSVLDPETKRSLLYSNNQALLAAVSDLPLSDAKHEQLRNDVAAPFAREEEWRKVKRAVTHARTLGSPVLICEDEWVLSRYAEVLSEAHGEEPPVLDLRMQRPDLFRPTINGSIISACNRLTARNGLLFVSHAEMPASMVEVLTQFLDPIKRKKYKLEDLGYCFDLSQITPVIFADTTPDYTGEGVVPVKLAPLSKEEARAEIERILAANKGIRLTEGAKKLAFTLSPKEMHFVMQALAGEAEPVDEELMRGAAAACKRTEQTNRRIGF